MIDKLVDQSKGEVIVCLHQKILREDYGKELIV